MPRLCVCVVVFVAACTDAADDRAPLFDEHGALIYGADDRREYFDITDPREKRLADATVVVVSASALTAVSGGWALDTSSTYGATNGLCADEPYRSQPDPGWCSGFAVGPNLIATAGHCVSSASCADTWFVFGFRMLDATTVRAEVLADDVYRCAAIVARAQKNGDDYAVVRLDRNIVGHPLLEIRRTDGITVGTPLVVAGHPAGIPLKVAAGATVRATAAAQYFEANVDSYEGNSGSPVMNANTGVVEGVLVRGNTDFVRDPQAGCYRSNVCPDTGCPTWEDASKTARFAAFVPPLAVCGDASACDDGNRCNGQESCTSGGCQPGVPVTCLSGSVCNPSTGACSAPLCGAPTTPCTSNTMCCSRICNIHKNRCR